MDIVKKVMKKFLPFLNELSAYRLQSTAEVGRRKSEDGKKGFTLIELLIVISIIAVLSVIGFAVYSNLGAQVKSRNIQRRADLDAIAKALEVNKATTSYVLLSNSQFSNAAIPQKDPQGYVYCGNTSFDTRPVDITAQPTTSGCTPAGSTTVSGYALINDAIPPVGTAWKICTWLEDEDGAGTASVAKAFCKLSAQ